MKKWIIAAALLLGTASAADAGWTECETLLIFPGFAIQQCNEKGHHYTPRNHYWGFFLRDGHGPKRHVYAPKPYRHDRHYNDRRWYPMKKDKRDRRHYRDHYR